MIEYIHYHYGNFFSLLRCSNFIPGFFVSDSQPNKKNNVIIILNLSKHFNILVYLSKLGMKKTY